MSTKEEKPGNDHEVVTIHIDSKEKKSPNPTTGAALYTLGEVKSGYELFREIPGKGDDELIKNDAGRVELKNGQHFYSADQSLNPGSLWI